MAIRSLAQTPDGFLWIASQEGLFRFDGKRFESVRSADRQQNRGSLPTTVYVSRRGELWVGYGQGGGIAVLRRGRLVDAGMERPPPIISAIAETARGEILAIWGGDVDRLRRLVRDRWVAAGDDWGLPPGQIVSSLVGPNGAVWLGMIDHSTERSVLALLPPGGRRFIVVPVRGRRPHLALDNAGAMWLSDSVGTRRLNVLRKGGIVDDAKGYPPLPGVRLPEIKFDDDGAIWGVTRSAGLFHIAGALHDDGLRSRVEAFERKDGLLSDVPNAIIKDREGSIWLGGSSGLERFRAGLVQPEAKVPADPIDGMVIGATMNGTVFVGTQKAIYEIRPGQDPRLRLSLLEGPLALCPAGRNDMWLVTAGKVLRISRNSTYAIAAKPPEAGTMACTEDGAGRLWLTGQKALYSHDRSGWHTVQPRVFGTAVGEEMVTRTDGRVFVNLEERALGVISGQIASSASADDLKVSYIRGVSEGERDVFVSGSTGLARLRGSTSITLGARSHPWAAGIRDLVQTSTGETWLLSIRGLYRMDTRQFDELFEHLERTPVPRRYDSEDGLSGATQRYGIRGPQIVAGGDGRIWFLMEMGLQRFDPRRIRREVSSPSVMITRVSGSMDPPDAGRVVELPQGTSRVSFDYTAPILSVPGRVQFRYRLVGVDDEWVNAGGRRQAFYSNLRPGSYRFQVIASNGDGVWNKRGDAVDFVIRPTFVQSWMFKTLCVLAAVGFLWLLYLLRVRFVAARIKGQMERLNAEREWLAQDLHDTLLQSVQGLIMRFHALSFSADARTSAAIAEALVAAEAVLTEGRERVAGLRRPQWEGVEPALREIVERFGPSEGMSFEFEQTGLVRALAPPILEEAVRIAGEALINARRHSGARLVRTSVSFRSDGLLIIVEDDGVGIAPEILARGGRPRHFGLPGMFERASRAGGELSIVSPPAGGTIVRLEFTANAAYVG